MINFWKLITATVTLENGRIGCGYTYTGGFGGAAIAKMLEQDLTPQLNWGTDEFSGKKMNDYMNQHIHYVARAESLHLQFLL